jgi:hypothetical protein
MTQSQVPIYNDPVDFESGETIFPCSTQYMIYNPLLHRYFLTTKALVENDIEIGEMQPDKLNLFIKKVSGAVYNYIVDKAGQRNFHIMCWRIATAPTYIFPDKYTMRKQFEEALIAQARFFIQNEDVREVARVDLAQGIPQPNLQPIGTERRDNLHMSPVCIEILDTLGLTRWFRSTYYGKLDINKY